MGWSGLVLRPAGDVLWGGPRDRPVPGLRQGSRENPGEIPALRVSGGEVFVCTLGVWPARGGRGLCSGPHFESCTHIAKTIYASSGP